MERRRLYLGENFNFFLRKMAVPCTSPLQDYQPCILKCTCMCVCDVCVHIHMYIYIADYATCARKRVRTIRDISFVGINSTR